MRIALACLVMSLVLLGGAVGAAAADQTFTLPCRLTNTPPRNGGNTPEAPFTQHFHVNLSAGTVDGKKAVITNDRVGWEPRQPEFRPYATLTRPQWQYHSARQIGQNPYELNGPCVVEK